ncbi:class I adenylate-forming enzyme family protein [Nocardia sp. alder85J]|uniref:class I adenylate-forming enzyme family protein n=1 Tax=Nocardia sp. alder85J TaxID=2862949 RepID=UPI001CD41D14|nr:class I adenylate-forming enzyme family protein [Nocardia sp. alder85J]MCX4096774.1 class I adenylate-forming enzyme family protein [Nocardia sp. alder85J]
MTVEPESDSPAPSLTVAAVLRERVRDRGDHPLLICDSGRLGYAEADRRSARLARGLITLGAGKGTHVGILFPNDPAFVVAALAVARIGAVAVPFSTFATAGELRQQLVDADIRILLAASRFRSHDYVQRLGEIVAADRWADGRPVLSGATPQLRHIVIDHGDDGERGPADAAGLPIGGVSEALLTAMEDDVAGSDPLAIIYTSGSTSTPKGVVHTHAAQLGHQRNLNAIRGLSAEDRLFCNSPFCWIGGFGFALLATLLAGSTLICSNAADDAVTLDLLEAEQPTITNGFAAGVAHLARHPSFAGRDLSSMRRGNLYPIMPADCRPADPELRHNMLGMTETGSVVLLDADETDQPEHRRGSFGKPAPGFEAKLVDPDTGAAVPTGETGELCFRGPHLMQGYHKRGREDCFDPDGWFHTGDLARIDAEGFVYFLGRGGSMIKTAGANVSPAEVAKAIATVTGGAVAHVIGLPDPERGQVVAAAVVVADPSAFDAEKLRRRLRAELSAYKVPRKLVGLTAAQVPLMSSGKIDNRRLGEVFDSP